MPLDEKVGKSFGSAAETDIGIRNKGGVVYTFQKERIYQKDTNTLKKNIPNQH